jgi:asparagine synthase (glutamine-hydrolysing)
MQGEAGEFVRDVLTSRAAKGRDFVNNELVASQIDNEPRFGRKIWGLLSLELWQQEFHDKESQFKGLLQDAVV